eukprot:2374609-Pyramimonas_sp.AAC.1
MPRMRHCKRLGCTSPPTAGPVPAAQSPSSTSSASGGGSEEGCQQKTTLLGSTPPARVGTLLA